MEFFQLCFPAQEKAADFISAADSVLVYFFRFMKFGTPCESVSIAWF